MTTISEVTDSTITVVVPIEVRRRNGRPKIVLPDNPSCEQDGSKVQASTVVIRAIARAWDWRRRIDAGEVATLQEIAEAESVTLPFVSRHIRLAYLSPAALARILGEGNAVAVPLDALATAALEPWTCQPARIF